MKSVSTLGKICAATLLATGVGFSATPAASALMNSPLAKADDTTSRSVVQLAGGVCTGTLIAPEWVLTADHCANIIDRTPNMRAVEVGEVALIGPDFDNREERKITAVYSHPTYDALLVKLDKPSTVIPAEVYSSTKEVPIGTNTVSYGWGDIVGEFDKKVGYQTGHVVSPVYSSAVGYENMLDGVNNILDGSGKAVTGDSGGPLFLTNGQLYGVLSGGSMYEDSVDTPSTNVYSQVPKLLDWMNKITGVDFTSPSNNAAIQQKVSSTTFNFLTPDNTFFAHTQAEEEEIFHKAVELHNTGKISSTSTSDVPIPNTETVVPLPEAETKNPTVESRTSAQPESSDTSVSSEAEPTSNAESTQSSDINITDGTHTTIESTTIVSTPQSEQDAAINKDTAMTHNQDVVSPDASVSHLDTSVSNGDVGSHVVDARAQADLQEAHILENHALSQSTSGATIQRQSSPSLNDSNPSLGGSQGSVASRQLPHAVSASTAQTQFKKVGPQVDTGGHVEKSVWNKIIDFLF